MANVLIMTRLSNRATHFFGSIISDAFTVYETNVIISSENTPFSTPILSLHLHIGPQTRCREPLAR
jgi:hypothetical protein